MPQKSKTGGSDLHPRTLSSLPRLGLFGTAITPAIAVATLVLHLIYGATLGWLLDLR